MCFLQNFSDATNFDVSLKIQLKSEISFLSVSFQFLVHSLSLFSLNVGVTKYVDYHSNQHSSKKLISFQRTFLCFSSVARPIYCSCLFRVQSDCFSRRPSNAWLPIRALVRSRLTRLDEVSVCRSLIASKRCDVTAGRSLRVTQLIDRVSCNILLHSIFLCKYFLGFL